jgi:predicted HD superfamily hydrolase involved in NAD metabolism
MMSEERALKILSANVPHELKEHCIRVAGTAVSLAAKFAPASVEKARIAGLLHDFCRALGDDELIRLADEMKLTLSTNARKRPVLIHGFVAAEILKAEYGLCDEGILNAIRHHTVGKAGMSALERIIYLSDGAEAGRSYPGVEELRAAMNFSLEKGCLVAARLTLRRLVDRGLAVEPGLIEMYNECLDLTSGAGE